MSRKHSSPESNPRLGAEIIGIVETQLRQGDPPETKQTFERLLSEGQDEDEAKRLIACVLAGEIFAIVKHKEPFDPVRYAKRLAQLPEMPW